MLYKFITIFLFVFSIDLLARDNELTFEEQQQGWQLLFDGKNMSQWRNFKNTDIRQQWSIQDNAIHLSAKGGGDLISKQQYQNFELKLDWKVSKKGNSGIFILADEIAEQIYFHAIEIQVVDNDIKPNTDKPIHKVAKHLSGAIFDIIPSPKASLKPTGDWNSVHIKFLNKQLTVWQNNIEVTDINLESVQWEKLVIQSKFTLWPGFAKNASGHIGLQDHGDPVWYKNIKIREL